jgi:hypothetical protein
MSFTPAFATVPCAAPPRAVGRVDIAAYTAPAPPSAAGPDYFDIEGHNVTRTPLTDVFFSRANVDAVQGALRQRVQAATGQAVGRQSDAELFIVMRSMYYQYGKNLPTDVLSQVRELNGLVLEYTVPDVVSNVRQFLKYRTDVSTLPVPLAHAPMATMKGSKQLEYRSFF